MALSTATAVTAMRDLTVKFDRAVKAATPYYPAIATVVQSEGAEEKYGWLGDMPGMREWVGDRVFNQLRAATYELANRHWESSLLVSKLDIADARMLKYGPLINALASEAAYHPDERMFDVMIAGETSPCFDGQLFYDTDHAFGNSGVQSNDLTFAAATGTTPTPTEFRGAYNQAYAQMLGFKNDQGKAFYRPTLNFREFKTIVHVAPSIYQIAVDGLSARFDADHNPISVSGNPEVVAIPAITNAAKFFVHNPNGLLKPFVFQQREPLSRQTKGEGDLETKDVKFMTESRYDAGYLAWWNSVLTTFT